MVGRKKVQEDYLVPCKNYKKFKNSLSINKLIGRQPRLLVYIVSAAVLCYNDRAGSETETVWPTKSKTFTIWLFTERVDCYPSLCILVLVVLDC